MIALSESGLTPDFTDAELGLVNYNVYRCDRNSNTSSALRGGGVLIAVAKYLPSVLLPSSDDIEQVFVKVGSAATSLIIGCVYLPPRSPAAKYQSFSDSVDRLAEEHQRNLYLFGDFNLPSVSWCREDYCSVVEVDPHALRQEAESAEILSDLCAFHNLYQNNDVVNNRGNLLDLVLANDVKAAVFLADDPLVRVDEYHPPLLVNIMGGINHTNQTGPRFEEYYYDYRSANFAALNDCLGQVNWDLLLNPCSLDDMLNTFYNILYSIIDTTVPKKKVSRGIFPRWFSPQLRQLTFAKKQAHRKFKGSGLYEDYIEFCTLRSECKTLSRTCYQLFVEQSEDSLLDQYNIKNFWNFINSKRKDCGMPSEMFYNDRSCQLGPDLPDLFADYFKTVYSTNPCKVSALLSYNNINICNYYIPISDIYEEICKLDVFKGPGPDGIPACILKSCSFAISRPLYIIFNLSLREGIFPSFWKTGYLTPIYKSGNRADVCNYRPVCNLSAIPKLFESLITKHFVTVLGPAVIDEQFGFQCGKSTELNLLTYVDYLSRVLDGGGEVHSIYTDFSKAFDRVNHAALLGKLEVLGVGGSLLHWVASYLSDRSLIIKINNFRSSEIRIPSGVPQGSHLGPLLFNLFINDIHGCFKFSKFLCFADDLKCFISVSSTDDCKGLQSDLKRLVAWCSDNGMDLNPSKCHSLCLSRNRNKHDFDYHIDGVALSHVTTVKDLGITIDAALSFVPHMNDMVSRALRTLGFVKRCTSDFRNPSAIRLLYISLVRPLLEYCSTVWNPLYACHIHRIEQVQRKFLRYLSFKSGMGHDPDSFHIDYGMLHDMFALVPLKVRRDQKDLKILFKILHSLVDCPFLLRSIDLMVPSRNTRSVTTFHRPFCRTNLGSNSFVPRTIKSANQLSDRLDFFVRYNHFLRLL